MGLPRYPITSSGVPCPIPRRIGRVRLSISSPSVRPSPFCRRVGIRISTFEACSGFTRVTARRIAQPPKAAFVTRLRSSRLTDQTARQLPEQSTIPWMDPSSTGDTRHRGAPHNARFWKTSGHVIDLDDPPRGFSRRHSYSAIRNGHDRTRRVFRPCKIQKNLHDGKGQFAVEVIFGNPEPSPMILHRGKDIRWGRSTGMDDYHRPVLKSDVTNGRKGQMASDIVRWNIDLEGKLAQHA